ncbi:hypothetical protein ACJJTC_015120 [Scirpophaga incertulas]
MWLLVLLLAAPALGLLNREPPLQASPNRQFRGIPEERWIDVRLDQFSTTNNASFPLRFYYNKLNATDKHMVLFVGGEWSVSTNWVTAGFPYDLASIIGASMFYPEQRYYGHTRPTADTEVESLRYLTTDNALRDLAQFIGYIKSDAFENGQYKSGKVVLVGCSSAGMKSTWLKQMYPHLVDVVVSHSGPLIVKENFPEYLEVVTTVMRAEGGEACTSSVKQAVNDVIAATATFEGRQLISNMFNTCTILDSNAPLDLFTLFNDAITYAFSALVQYAAPGDVAAACKELTDPSIPSAMRRMANWVNKNRPNPSKCFETRYMVTVDARRDPSYNSTEKGTRLFAYKWCTEYGWIQTTDSKAQIFNNTIPLDFNYDICKDYFTTNINQFRLQQNIARTHEFFGGLKHIPQHVISVQGTADPWHVLGPTRQQNTPTTPVYILEGSAHCRATDALNINDSEEMRKVKLQIVDNVKAFLKL